MLSFAFCRLVNLPLFHRQARSLGLRPASLVDDLGQYEDPDLDRSLVVAQMLLDAIDVQPRDLVDGLVEVDDARRAIDALCAESTARCIHPVRR